jgi:hypothetical protein
MKHTLSVLLVSCFLVAPYSIQADPPDNEKASRVVAGVAAGVTALIVIGVGAIIVTGLKKMCKKIPPYGSSTNLPPALDDITKRGPKLDSPTNIETSMVSFEEGNGVSWQEVLTVTFDDNMNATVTQNGAVILTNAPCYTVPSSNGEFLVYYDLRQVWIEQKPFAFFRLMSQ